jgi:hypothetical protein
MAMSLLRNNTKVFLLDCVSLSSPKARLSVISAAIVTLCFVNLGSFKLPDLCLWEKLFGYCPAKGTTHALFAFFHGNWREAFHYNRNVTIIVPALAFFLVSDTARIIRQIIEKIHDPKATGRAGELE